MNLNDVLSILIVFTGTTVGSFVVAVVLDDVAGVALAVKTRTFSAKKLPSFLRSQFGTVEAFALGGIIIAAVTSATGAALLHGGLDKAALQGIADAGFAAATAGAAAMLLAVLSDLYGKVSQLFGTKVAAPA